MNAFNRLVMLVIAILLVAAPALILLAVLGVIPSQAASAAASPLSTVPGAIPGAGGGASAVVVAASIVIGIVALFLIFRELRPGPRAAKHVSLQNNPGRQTRLSASAVKSLAGGAATEAGAYSPSVSLSSKKGAYVVDCRVEAAPEADLGALAEGVRDNIERILGEQSVPHRGVEVTINQHVSAEQTQPARTDSEQKGGSGLLSRVRS